MKPTNKQLREINDLQLVVFVMCGGGYIGNFAACQPAEFYIDDRGARRPYPLKKISIAVKYLKKRAEQYRFDVYDMPKMSSFHNNMEVL